MKTLWMAVLALVMAGCDSTSLLDSVQDGVDRYNEAKVAPTITPPGGTFRTALSIPTVVLSTSVTGARLIYTRDGSTPVFNTAGSVQYPTTQMVDSTTLSWSLGSFATGNGIFPLRALSWRDKVASNEALAYFRVPGSGGTVWSKTGLGAPAGQVLAMARYEASSQNNLGGWVTSTSGRKAGFLIQTDDHGTPQWGVPIDPATSATTSTSSINAVATDASGNIYVVGDLVGADTYSFGPKSVAVAGNAGFVAKFTSAGACLWVETIQSATGIHLSGVACPPSTSYLVISGWSDGSGTMVALGSASGTSSTYGPLIAKSAVLGVSSCGFLIQYTTAGYPTFLWSGGQDGEADRFYGVSGNSLVVAVVGAFLSADSAATYDFGGSSTVSGPAGTWQGLLVTFVTGSGVSTKAVTSTGAVADTRFTAVAVNQGSGAIAVAADQSGTSPVTWGTQTWAGGSPGANGLVVYYDSSATTTWVAGLISGQDSAINGVGFTPSTSYLYAAGRIGKGTTGWANTTDVAAAAATPTTFPSAWGPTSRSPVVVQLTPSLGTANWVRSTGSGSTDAENFAVAGAGSTSMVAFAAGTAPGRGPLVWDEALKVAGPGSGDNPLLYEVYE